MAQVKRPDGITAIAIIEFVLAALFFIGALAILVIPVASVIAYSNDTTGLIAALFGLGIGVLVTGGLGVFMIAAGIGLLRLKNWARVLTIVLAILLLPGFPIGTLLGVLALWYLFQDEVKSVFQGSGQAPTPPTPGAQD